MLSTFGGSVEHLHAADLAAGDDGIEATFAQHQHHLEVLCLHQPANVLGDVGAPNVARRTSACGS